MVNPFKYGREVSGRQFYDRQEAFNSLYSKLAGGSANVVMYAPRRYGKTSLVKKVLARFSEEGVPCVYFDLNRVESLERFCEAYASALYSLVGGAKGVVHTLAEYLSHLHPTFSFGGEFPVSVKFDYGRRMNSTSLAEILGIAEKIAVEHVHGPIIVAFDEFQEIRGLTPDLPLEGIFRGVIQEQQNVRYVFLGSKTHMLKRMFGEKSRPFYKSAATIKLGKPPEDQSRAFVAERFSSCGIGIDATDVSRIVEASENIPYYLQELSSQVFDKVVTAGRDWVESADVDAAVDNLLEENADWYFEQLKALPLSQRVLVRALAAEPVREFPAEYRERHSLGVSSTVHTALLRLVDAGIVESDESGYCIGDPFFARAILMPPGKKI
jgi:AAA+ ATPase superfamily predicted ATPase